MMCVAQLKPLCINTKDNAVTLAECDPPLLIPVYPYLEQIILDVQADAQENG